MAKKRYCVVIEFDPVEINVTAKNKTEARKKAIEKLKKKNIVRLIRRSWRTKKRMIDVEEIY